MYVPAAAPLTIDLTHDDRPGARTRRVDAEHVAEIARTRSLATHTWAVVVRHGGTVANCYGSAAWTQVVLAACDPHGAVVVWGGNWITANKATKAGAADAALPGARWYWDGRASAVSKRESLREIKRAHAEAHQLMGEREATLPAGSACVGPLPTRVRKGLRARRVAADLRAQAAALAWVRAGLPEADAARATARARGLELDAEQVAAPARPERALFGSGAWCEESLDRLARAC